MQFGLLRLALLAVLVCFTSIAAKAQAQSQVRISVSLPAEIRVDIQSLSPMQSWSFRNTYAGVLGLADRIEDFRAQGGEGSDGRDAGARKIATGEFRSSVAATAISYIVRLRLPGAADVSHVSWIAGDSGFLMFADLLPENLQDLSVQFSLPSGWSLHSTTEPDAQGKHHVVDPEKSVFFVGRSLRKESKRVKGMDLECVVDGKWPFKQAAVMKAAGRVIEKYHSLTGFRLPDKSVVMVAPLPVAVGSVKWRAETRGSAVVLLMDPQASIKNWTGQLGVIFTHELLHLWVPNSLRLQGDYDWFFEGFTLYTALVTALELKLINFDEYLATLARVYDSYLSYPDGVSLVDASERRWTSGNAAVYDKGMLVAFLYDLIIRKESAGKTRLTDLYRDLFARRVAEPANGNEVIITLLSSTPAAAELAKSYIEGSKELELERLLRSYGLVLKDSRLTIDTELHTHQRQLLKSLGYR